MTRAAGGPEQTWSSPAARQHPAAQPAPPAARAVRPAPAGARAAQPAPAGARARQASELVHDLYRDHAVSLIRMAKLLLRDQASAEDVVQDAFLGLHRAMPRLTDRDQLLPYLRAAVINGCRSVLRGRQRALRRRVQHEPSASSAEYEALASDERRVVMAAVGKLPRRSREVLVLRYYLGLPDHEIAAALRVSRGTVSSTASRAVAALGRELKKEGL